VDFGNVVIFPVVVSEEDMWFDSGVESAVTVVDGEDMDVDNVVEPPEVVSAEVVKVVESSTVVCEEAKDVDMVVESPTVVSTVVDLDIVVETVEEHAVLPSVQHRAMFARKAALDTLSPSISTSASQLLPVPK